MNEGFRYRELETGTWLSRDPAGFVDGPNLYAYVRCNPWTKFDPLGLEIELTSSDVDWSYFTEQNSVTGFNSEWSSKAHHITAPNNFDRSNVRSEILGTMMKSDSNFKFKDTNQLERHVQARVHTIEAAKNMKAKFSMGSDTQKFGPDATRNPKTGYLVPSPGKTREEAISSTLNSPDSVIDCSKAAKLAIQLGVLKQGDKLPGDSFDAGLSERRVKDKKDWVPGDRCRLPDFDGPNQGENVLYLGNGDWQGHADPKPIHLNEQNIDSQKVESIRSYPSTGEDSSKEKPKS